LAGSEKLLEKRFEDHGKVLEFFVVKSVGTLIRCPAVKKYRSERYL